MSNIRSGGTEIHRTEHDYRLFHYAQDNQVVGYRRLYVDGEETNTWGHDDYGTPQEAKKVLPGLRETLESL